MASKWTTSPLYRWVQRFTPLLIDAARPVRHLASDRWFVDESYVKVSGVWSYVYRAVDQHGQVIDVYVSQRRDLASARTFFTAALAVHGDPCEVITDRAAALANVIEDLIPAAFHNTGQKRLGRPRDAALAYDRAAALARTEAEVSFLGRRRTEQDVDVPATLDD